MPYIDTGSLDEAALARLSPGDAFQIYNGLDACVTREVFDVIWEIARSQNEPYARDLYNFERGMQGLALDMMQRGFCIDSYQRRKMTEHYSRIQDRVMTILNRYAFAIWKAPLNPASPKQLMQFFYGALKLPEQFTITNKQRVVSCNRDALEKLLAYYYTVPIINCIFEARDAAKKISVLTTGITNGRFHSTFSPASTETGRWSSSKDAFGEGGNAQNITGELRRMFVADRGYKLLHFDQEQAESRIVGLILWSLGDDRYIRACESGDLHTQVAALVWPDRVKDKSSAETTYYRHFSYRDMSKRGGHLSNYMGKPRRMADALRLPLEVCVSFQELYYRSFGLPRFHQHITQQLQLQQCLTTPLGMQRTFFGNPYDDEVIREAIAFIPQSTVGQLTSLIAHKVWLTIPELQPLTHDHDGFTWQFPDDRELERRLVEKVTEISSIPLSFKDRTIRVPIELSTGWNWAAADKPPFLDANKKSTNPDGLRKWRGSDDRRRLEGAERYL